MATLPKVLINQADIKSAGGVALRLRTQAVAPRIAPPLAAYSTRTGSRVSFAVLIVFGGSDLLLAVRQHYETNHNRGSADQLVSCCAVMGAFFARVSVLGSTLATSLSRPRSSSCSQAAPYVTTELMGRSPAEYRFYLCDREEWLHSGHFSSGRSGVSVRSNGLVQPHDRGDGHCRSHGCRVATGTSISERLVWAMFCIGARNGLCCRGGSPGRSREEEGKSEAGSGRRGSRRSLAGTYRFGFVALVAPFVGATLD